MADPTEYYVDHDNGNDSTGDGSSGTPWKTIAYALKTGISTPNTSNGDRIWVTGTGGETLAETWGSSVFIGPYGDGEPLQIIGYGSTTGDGIAAPVIKSASTFYIYTRQGSDWVNWANINFQHNGTATYLIDTTKGKFQNCHFTRTVDTTGGYINGSSFSNIIEGCSFVDCGTFGAVHGYNLAFIGNIVKEQGSYTQEVGSGDALIEAESESGMFVAEGNIFINSGGYGCRAKGLSVIRNNSFFCADSSTNSRGAIATSNSTANCIIENNIISSYNGTFHAALRFGTLAQGIICRNNSFYDVTAVDVNTPSYMIYDGNETLATDPFTDAANGDFTPIDTGSIKEGSYPSSFPDI